MAGVSNVDLVLIWWRIKWFVWLNWLVASLPVGRIGIERGDDEITALNSSRMTFVDSQTRHWRQRTEFSVEDFLLVPDELMNKLLSSSAAPQLKHSSVWYVLLWMLKMSMIKFRKWLKIKKQLKFVLFLLPHDVGIKMRRQISSIGHRHFGVGNFGRRMFLTHVECWWEGVLCCFTERRMWWQLEDVTAPFKWKRVFFLFPILPKSYDIMRKLISYIYIWW